MPQAASNQKLLIQELDLISLETLEEREALIRKHPFAFFMVRRGKAILKHAIWITMIGALISNFLDSGLFFVFVLAIPVLIILIGVSGGNQVKQFETALEQKYKTAMLEALVQHFFPGSNYDPLKGLSQEKFDGLDVFYRDIDLFESKYQITGRVQTLDFSFAEVRVNRTQFYPAKRKKDNIFKGLVFLAENQENQEHKYVFLPRNFPYALRNFRQATTLTGHQSYQYFQKKWLDVPKDSIYQFIDHLEQFNTSFKTELLIGNQDETIFAYMPVNPDFSDYSLQNAHKTEKISPDPEVIDELFRGHGNTVKPAHQVIQEMVMCNQVIRLMVEFQQLFKL